MFVASENEIRAMHIKDDLESGGEERRLEPSRYETIKLPNTVKIHALLLNRVPGFSVEYFFVVIETPSHLLDFNLLTIHDFP